MARVRVYFKNIKEYDDIIGDSFEEVKDLVKYSEGSWYSAADRVWTLNMQPRTLERLQNNISRERYEHYKQILEVASSKNLSTSFSFLYSFQVEGIKQLRSGKVLLCDDVGLGKTLQTIAFCETENFKNVLIIAPAPLKDQWKEEIEKHFKQKAIVLKGSSKDRKKLLEEFSSNEDIKYLILNYEQLSERNKKLFENLETDWNLVVLDEVHRVKNSKSVASKFIRKNFGHIQKLGLTATPLVNNLRELFNIGNLLTGNTFMSWITFDKHFCIRETIHKRDIPTGEIEAISIITGYKNIEEFYDKYLSKIMIRRKKKDVLSELPERIYKDIRFDLDTLEQSVHNDFIVSAAVAHENNDEMNLLKYVTHARQCCNSLEILPDSVYSHLNYKSSKIEALKTVLEEIDDKVLIFTQYEKMAHIIARDLGEENCLVISGATEDKIGEIKKFKDSATLKYLISTDTLNYGVNLEFINKLVHFDLPWTPAKVEQREGRIDRITQQRGMLIYKLIANNSFDEHVAEVIETKKSIFETAVDGTKKVIDEYFKD